jgi:hypothetical protein
MTLRDKCAHFDIGQRAVLFALTRDVPLNVSLLASHGFLVSLRGGRHQARSILRSPWPFCMAPMWFERARFVNWPHWRGAG